MRVTPSPRSSRRKGLGRRVLRVADGLRTGRCSFLIEGSTENVKASNQAFPFVGGDRCLSGRADEVKVGPQATDQRSPTKAVAKCAGHCHLTVTPAPPPPPPPRAFVYHGSRRGARGEPGHGATVPGESWRAGLRAFRPRSPRLTSTFLPLQDSVS